MELLRLPTREGYDLWAAIYDGEDNPLIRLESRFLPGLLGEVAGLWIADVGCGTGRHALPLGEAGARVVGIDFSAGMLARANGKRSEAGGSPLFLRASVDALPLAPRRFDRVLCCLVLDHIAELDPFFAELARLLAEDGFLLCSVMHPAMNLQGIEARFTDPASGREIRPTSARNTISDYLMAADRAGLRFEHLSEHAVDEELCAASPRACKYLGWPLLFLIRLRLA
jgi:malonyl-CoA O-methyltransferase